MVVGTWDDAPAVVVAPATVLDGLDDLLSGSSQWDQPGRRAGSWARVLEGLGSQEDVGKHLEGSGVLLASGPPEGVHGGAH